MKTNTKITFLVVLMLFIGSFVHASFPVKESNSAKSIENVKQNAKNIEQKSTQIKSFDKSEVENKVTSKMDGDNDMLITTLLFILLGFIAAHRWYKKKPAIWNILFILTGGGFGIWAIVDLYNILTGKF